MTTNETSVLDQVMYCSNALYCTVRYLRCHVEHEHEPPHSDSDSGSDRVTKGQPGLSEFAGPPSRGGSESSMVQDDVYTKVEEV